MVVPSVAVNLEGEATQLVADEPIQQFKQRPLPFMHMGQIDSRPEYGIRARIGAALLEDQHAVGLYVSTTVSPAGPARDLHPDPRFAELCAAEAECLETGRCIGCTWPLLDAPVSATKQATYLNLMRHAQFSLVILGDTPSTSRMYDAISAGTVPVIVSDEIWAVGLPFPTIVPWQGMALRVSEHETEVWKSFNQELNAIPDDTLENVRRLLAEHRDDLLWTSKCSRVVDNILLTAMATCQP